MGGCIFGGDNYSVLKGKNLFHLVYPVILNETKKTKQKNKKKTKKKNKKKKKTHKYIKAGKSFDLENGSTKKQRIFSNGVCVCGGGGGGGGGWGGEGGGGNYFISELTSFQQRDKTSLTYLPSLKLYTSL